MNALPGAVVAVDFGEKRTGIAACDPLRIAAIPVGVIASADREELLERVIAAAEERNAMTLVVGLPLHMWGGESPRVAWVRGLCAEIRQRMPNLEIVEWDERLTSKEATILLAAAGIKGKKRKDHLDAVAATLILRSWMQAERNRGA
jgi:putative Holliday junction resolvase